MRPLDDAPNTDELLPDLLADTRARTDRAKVTDALDAIDGALTNNIRPLTGAAAMSEPKMHHLDPCVRVEASASRHADLEGNALRKAASAFEGYFSPDGWRSASGRRIHAVMVGHVEPEIEQPMRGTVLTWRADFIVGLDSRESA